MTALALLWAGFAYNLTRPPSYRHYHRTMVQVAGSAHDAVRVGWLVAGQELADQAFATFIDTSYDDVLRTLAGAQHQFAGEAPPDERSRALRDELAPLLQRAGVAATDAAAAPDDAALRRARDELGTLADRLDDFLTAHG